MGLYKGGKFARKCLDNVTKMCYTEMSFKFSKIFKKGDMMRKKVRKSGSFQDDVVKDKRPGSNTTSISVKPRRTVGPDKIRLI